MTGVAFITVTPDGENAIVVAPGANLTLSPLDADSAKVAIGGATVLVAQLEVPVAVVARVAEIARSDARVILNAAPVRDLPASLLNRVDVLVVNEHEAGQLTGQRVTETRDAIQATSKLLAFGPAAVVITLGAKGAVLAHGATRQHLPAVPATVVDSTGAGDAFVGALAAKMAASATLDDAVRYAVEVGTATVGHHGAEPRLPAATPDALQTQ
jgi:ribokinase